MKKFKNMISRVVPIPIENIDTDQIIPSRFLKESNKKKLGKNLFSDWRYKKDGSLNQDFILNSDEFFGKILLSGKNFGCGSSREHAVWAIFDYGFRVVIANSFSDIFKDNALNNGLLVVELSEGFVQTLFKIITNNPRTEIQVDLIHQKVLIMKKNNFEKFYIHPYRKSCFLNGYDDIDFLITMKKEIEIFEKKNILLKK
ncbi:3-isopropylmalate dehydratase small subunit [Blattabacterium cuenoti]|uniref:3-isopropylmalate dehydratase small subunit n=1 Tax=Blattabacterium cuenoti TaxID=1653831 RepID=UPI00163B7E1A|nr:3-isopropylmalate dehydratase small subunit [Blattabacterium cuenoti]